MWEFAFHQAGNLDKEDVRSAKPSTIADSVWRTMQIVVGARDRRSANRGVLSKVWDLARLLLVVIVLFTRPVINARYLRTATGAGIAIHVLLVVPLVLNTTRLSLVLAPQIRIASLVRWLSIANGVQITELLANVKQRGPQQIIRNPVSLLTPIPAMTTVKRLQMTVARVAEP